MAHDDRLERSSHLQLGRHYYQMHRYAEAKSHFLQAIAEKVELEVLSYLAHCCLLLNQYDEAEAFCRQSIEMGYQSVFIYRILGIIHYGYEHYDESEQALLHALTLDSESVETLAHYAHLMLLKGRNQKAYELLAEATRLNPSNSVLLHFKHEYETVNGTSKTREQALQEYLHSRPDDVNKLIKLSNVAIRKKRYKEARECLRQVIVLDPTHQGALKSLAELDRLLHPLYWPKRMLSYPAGRLIWIVVSVGCIMLMTKVGEKAQLSFFFLLFAFIFYNSFGAEKLYEWITKRRGGS